MTKAERLHNQRLVEYGCYVCRHHYGVYSKPVIHHVRRLATSKKRDRAPKIPLCSAHHAGHGVGVSIHDGRESWEANFGSEIEMAKEMEFLFPI